MSERRVAQRPGTLGHWAPRPRPRQETPRDRGSHLRRAPSSAAEASDGRDTPFETGDWIVEPSRHLARSRDGRERRLGPRGTDLLVLLAGAEGRVLEKEELLEVVWEGRFVSENALSVAIYELRRALGDDAGDPRYIETIHGRGYRWIPPVRPLRGRPGGRSRRGVVPGPGVAEGDDGGLEGLRRRIQRLEVENARLLALLREGA